MRRNVQKPSETSVQIETEKVPPISKTRSNDQSPIVGSKPKESGRKRIMITGCNSLVGHSLFESMRNDHLAIKTGAKAHRFVSTYVRQEQATTPMPSDFIKVLDILKKPKTFTKNVLMSDVLIIDL
jgi:hypothetical protein